MKVNLKDTMLSVLDVRTGEPTRPLAQQPVPAYEVKVEENSILVRKHQ